MLSFTQYLQEISIAALGALTFYLIRWARIQYLNLKYSMTGWYISRIETLENGEKIIEKCKFRLVQKGLKFVGKEYHQDGRIWIHEGSIFNTIYLSGIYRSQAINAKGVGSFFLEDIGDDFEGWWSGTNMDSDHLFIDKGVYTLTKILDTKIKDLKKNNVPAVVHMLDKLNLQNLIEQEETKHATPFQLNDKSQVNLVASYKTDIVGYVFGYKLDANQLSSIIGDNPPDNPPLILKHADSDGQIGIVKIFAVSEQYQNRGIGTKLIDQIRARLEKIGVKVLLVQVIKPGEEPAKIESMLDFLGFEKAVKVGDLVLYSKVC